MGAIAFVATRGFETVDFLLEVALALAIIFLVGLLFTGALAFAVFRATAFWATALFALGRLALALSVCRFAADFVDER